MVRQESMRFRHWWNAFLWAPLGAMVAGIVFVSFAFADAPTSSLTVANLQDGFGVVIVGVVYSYLVGLILLPAFWVFERLRWQGWRAYLPTGLAAGALTGLTDGPPAFLIFSMVSGTLCAAVFTLRLRTLRQSGAIVEKECAPYA